jgi:hypothetical protein
VLNWLTFRFVGTLFLAPLPYYLSSSGCHFIVKVKFLALLSDLNDDESLPIINKPKHQKEGKTNNKMHGPMSKKTKESPKKVNHEENVKFPNPLQS